MAWKSQYANELELTVSRFRAVSGPTKRSSYVKGNWWVECCFIQRLATGATGVKQARYRRRPTRGNEALVRACAVYTQRYIKRRLCTINIPDLDIYAHALIFDFTIAARGKRRADLQAFCEVPILH